MEIAAVYKNNMYFEATADGLVVGMDALPEHGGQGQGILPKQLVLAGLAGCTGMDVVSILKKMRQSWQEFQIKVNAEKSTTHPIVFTKVHIKYIFKGVELDKEKVEKAVRLSQEQYCGVGAMLRKATEISWEIEYQ
ncbi:MAG: OsmC family protein [Candidatus Margulisbacteria bacterium]|nr:OsmC family protein [Candidatus Margulisiibacteriota bacterium]